jgi:hypothetical protein
VTDTRQVTALAHAAAEAIRDLNHATRHHDSLAQPGDAYELTGALFLTASRLPQLITQISACLNHALAGGRLGHDLGEDPALAVDGAVIFLGDARRSAGALAGDLDAACQQLALINGQPSLRSKDNQQP